MINERYVLDAPVAAKWFLNDEDVVDIAETFLIRFLAKEIVFYAPHILEYELGHIITRAQLLQHIRETLNGSDVLWPFFVIRIPSLGQPAVQRVIREENLDPSNEVQLLKRFGKTTIANPFTLIPKDALVEPED